ncbi:hypothetical protein MSPP1_001329 [Malassezia sp. CBS 17886]|nr:hypothetical protein MSPP1_001329 [Malassezia sp. CBS 17886]
MSRRAVVRYDDLVHDDGALPEAERSDGAHADGMPAPPAPAPSQRRKRKAGAPRGSSGGVGAGPESVPRYRGPHWDELGADVDAASARAAPPWSDPAAAEYTAVDADSDDAMIASPSPSPRHPFLLRDMHVPSAEEHGTVSIMSEDVWDDRFLIDVWNAAEKEYAEFHDRRTEAIDVVVAEGGADAWHRLPVASPGRGALGDECMEAPCAAGEQPDDTQGTPGWRRAQELMAATAARRGVPAVDSARPGLGAVPMHPHPPLPAGIPHSDEIQNLVMAWYYTGYYTAQYQQMQGA